MGKMQIERRAWVKLELSELDVKSTLTGTIIGSPETQVFDQTGTLPDLYGTG